MDNGWIKLHRKLLDNPIVMKDADHLAIWIWILLNVSRGNKSVIFKGKKIDLLPGQMTVGRKQIADNIGVNETKVRRVLDAFESDQQIDQQMSNKCRLITVKKWSEYQEDDQQKDRQVTNKRPTDDQQMTTKQEVKKERKREITTIATTSVADGEKEKKKKNHDDPMNLEEFVAYMKKSSDRAIQIIGEWADTIKPNLSTWGQWEVFMRRHLRAARDVAPFTDKQLEMAYSKITDMQAKRDFKPTLETLKKFLT